MKMKYEMEITGDFEFNVMYHSFDKLEDFSKELKWLMNLETPLLLDRIESIRIYKTK